jgi:hypothetical protein
VGAAIFDIRISCNFVWFTTAFGTLKEEIQNTSHIFWPQKRASETGNLTPLMVIRLRYFNSTVNYFNFK